LEPRNHVVVAVAIGGVCRESSGFVYRDHSAVVVEYPGFGPRSKKVVEHG
jgi:hypothetical protein